MDHPAHDRSAAVCVRPLEIAGTGSVLMARLYRGAGRPAAPSDTLLVFFHPGGFISGSLDASDACLREFASNVHASVLAPTYTQAPDEPFPAAAEDAYAAIAACAARPRHHGWTGRTLVVSGVEAGGNLAAVATLMARDRGGPAVAGQLLIAPMLDPGLSSGSMRDTAASASAGRIAAVCADGYRDYLPRAVDRIHPYACPLASSRLKGLPPTLIFSIEGDPLRDEADAYATKLALAGVRVEARTLRTATACAPQADANARCSASWDDASFAAINRFIASLQAAPPPVHPDRT